MIGQFWSAIIWAAIIMDKLRKSDLWHKSPTKEGPIKLKDSKWKYIMIAGVSAVAQSKNGTEEDHQHSGQVGRE